MKCPYDHKTVCAYLEAKDPINFACNKCPKYTKYVQDSEDPIDGGKTVGCLFIGIAILAAFGMIIFNLIKTLR